LAVEEENDDEPEAALQEGGVTGKRTSGNPGAGSLKMARVCPANRQCSNPKARKNVNRLCFKRLSSLTLCV